MSSELPHHGLLPNVGEFLRDLHYCTRPGGSPLSEGGWEEIVEAAILSATGIRNLLCSKRENQGEEDFRVAPG